MLAVPAARAKPRARFGRSRHGAPPRRAPSLQLDDEVLALRRS
jgi:hypothetical protein